MKSAKTKTVLLLAAGLMMSANVAAENKADSILACVGANSPQKTFSLMARFTTTSAAGDTQELRTRFYGERDDEGVRINIRITAPPNLEGTSFLIRESKGDQDDMRIFIPALRKTRRISGAMAARELWGTSFSYLDIKSIFGAFIDGERLSVETREHAGRKLDAVTVRPAAVEAAPFEYMTALVDPKTCVPLSVEFMDEERQMLKQLDADPDSILMLGKSRQASRFTMQDLISGNRTELEFSQMQFDEKVNPRAFKTSAFQTVE